MQTRTPPSPRSISRSTVTIAFALTIAATLLGAAQRADATVAPCLTDGSCQSSFSIFFNGSSSAAGTGTINIDPETNALSLSTEGATGPVTTTAGGGLMWTMPTGETIRIDSVTGDADPVLGFGLGASTSGSSSTFAFAFDLPIALEGTIATSSSVSYSLTSLSSAGADISPLLAGGNVVTSQDVDTSVGGLLPLNKEVDVGERFFFLGGPQTQNSQVYADNDTIIGSLDYDLMSVLVSFALSADSTVGISGFVQQTVVPLPAALPLLLSGLAGIGFAARRRTNT